MRLKYALRLGRRPLKETAAPLYHEVMAISNVWPLLRQGSLREGVVAMKNMGKLIAVLACALALCFALAGCDSNTDQYKKNFQGNWELSGLTEGDTTYNESDLSMLKSWGMNVTLSMNEDGTMAIDYFGETAEGNWEAKDANTVTLKMLGDSVDGKLSDGVLSVEVEGASMQFKKAES